MRAKGQKTSREAEQLTFHLTAQQLHSQPQSAVSGSLGVDPDEPRGEGWKGPQLRCIVVVVAFKRLKNKNQQVLTNLPFGRRVSP